MLRQEKEIGDYTTFSSIFAPATGKRRIQMVIFIEELQAIKKYSVDTLFQAVSLADRYIAQTVIYGTEAPNIVILSVTCILLAAKLEEHKKPSYERMAN